MKTIFLAEVVALMSLVLLTQQARAGEDYPPRYSSSATRIKIGSGVRVILYTGKPESQEQLVTTPIVGLKSTVRKGVLHLQKIDRQWDNVTVHLTVSQLCEVELDGGASLLTPSPVVASKVDVLLHPHSMIDLKTTGKINYQLVEFTEMVELRQSGNVKSIQQ